MSPTWITGVWPTLFGINVWLFSGLCELPNSDVLRQSLESSAVIQDFSLTWLLGHHEMNSFAPLFTFNICCQVTGPKAAKQTDHRLKAQMLVNLP